MSGGGGGVYAPGEGEPIQCDLAIADIVLVNVDEDALSDLEIGDELEVTLEGSSPIVVSSDGFVGSISHPKVAQLIRCMREGYDYIAYITDLDEDDKRCVVTIRNA